MSIYARLIVLAALALALAAGAWKCYTAGQNNVRAEWTAEKLATSESARLRERAAQKTTERIDRENEKQKDADRIAAAAAADRLREFIAAGSDTTASTPGGLVDPNRAIADQCSESLGKLDEHAKSLERKARGLQGYAIEVCLAK